MRGNCCGGEMRLEELDSLRLTVFEDFEIFFVEAGYGGAFFVGNNDVDQHVAHVDLQRLTGRLIVFGLCGGNGRSKNGGDDSNNGNSLSPEAEHDLRLESD
jgi:hypothetical protein